MLGHPACTGKVTFQGLVSPFRLFSGVNAEYNASHFFLAGPLGIGVEEAKVGDEVLFVLFGDLIGPGNLVGDNRVHFGFAAHRRPPPFERSFLLYSCLSALPAGRSAGVMRRAAPQAAPWRPRRTD